MVIDRREPGGYITPHEAAGDDAAHQRELRVEDQRDDRARRPDTERDDQQGEQRQAGDRIEDAGDPHDHRPQARSPRGEHAER